MTEDDRLFRVHVCYSLPECDVVQSMLAAYGIPSHIGARFFAGLHPHLLVALDGMRIAVPFAVRANAFRLISEVRKSSASPESAAFQRHGALYSLVFVVMFFTGMLYPPIWVRWREGVFDEIEGPAIPEANGKEVDD